MKRTVLFGLMCVIATWLSAQTLQDNELALVYYMPQTQLVFDIEYEEVVLKKGPFMDYAKQYLGTTEVITEDSRSFRIAGVKMRTKTIADLTRAYKVNAENGIESQLISLTPFGTLKGYNTRFSNSMPPCKHTPACEAKEQPLPVMPLLEEHIVGKSVAQQAQGASKLIYRIRENRMYLLGGEVDHAPADGKAMELLLGEMDKQERQLVELFIGTRKVIKHHKTVTYTPVKTEEVELCLFSDKEGMVSEGGEPVMLQLIAQRQSRGMAHSDKKDKKAPQPSQIFYNLPGSANMKVVYLNETLLERNAQIAQFGVAIPLAKDLFAQKPLPQIQFDTETGNIKSINRNDETDSKK